MNIIVISLERAKGRREKIKSQLDSLALGGIIMDAVDGQVLSESERNKKIHLERGYRFGEVFKPGEIACTMSHIKALRLAKKYEWPYLIVLEDDVILAEDLEKRIKILFKILPNDWEHVYLSGIPRLGFMSPPMLDFLNVVPTIFTECTHSMIIRNNSYDKIINYLLKFETTTDDSYNYLISSGNLKSYTYYPFVSYASDDYTYIWNHNIKREHKSKQYFKNKL
jgi:GR25 family glycosyltransferase involved in LPS biosynthesis